jgi:hypothetical protein
MRLKKCLIIVKNKTFSFIRHEQVFFKNIIYKALNEELL